MVENGGRRRIIINQAPVLDQRRDKPLGGPISPFCLLFYTRRINPRKRRDGPFSMIFYFRLNNLLYFIYLFN